MFTGWVAGVGRIEQITRGAKASTLAVYLPASIDITDVRLGESIAVDGVCLTVTSLRGQIFIADASPETLARTTLAHARAGVAVNVERALAVGDRLHGHIVQGHVDGVGTIEAVTPSGNALDIDIELPADLRPLTVEKGSIAIDGISLTISALTGTGVRLTIIPHTATGTTLTAKKPGDRVNVEADILGKYVQRLLGLGQPATHAPDHGAGDARLMDALRGAGFV